MINWMKLRNLALVEEVEVEFGSGFNVITGETGAGKSVIMGAVDLLLGGRADKSSIRTGADRCEIAAEFTVPDSVRSAVTAVLEDAAAEETSPDFLLIRRVITKTSTRNFINGTPVTLSVLQRLGRVMVDIHAANTSQSLLQSAEQLAVLDRFGHLADRLARTSDAWRKLTLLREEQEQFRLSLPSGDEVKRLRRDAGEIRAAAPEPGEDEALKTRHDLAANSRSVMECAYGAGEALAGDGDGSVFQMVTEVRRQLSELEKFDPSHGAEFLSRLEDISESVSSLAQDLESHAASVELDGNEFQAMEDRMRVLQTLKRRYGPTLDDVLASLESMDAQIARFDDAFLIRERYEKQEKELYSLWKAEAEQLSLLRKTTAHTLIEELSVETSKLGFKQALFDIEFQIAPDGPDGFDRIEFLFSANPGVPPCPLHAVASSGEISRVMLAVKTVLAEADAIPVLIFDEIDANIGGETAWTVGAELRKLANTKQILCISHLAQVARAADTHFLVAKNAEDGVTRTRIHALSASERIEELARMLGGGTAALEHAKTLLPDVE